MKAQVGEWYQVEYQVRGMRRNRVMVAQYLGGNADHSNWSLHPLGGTQNLPHIRVVAIRRTPIKQAVLPTLVGKESK
jgi:hypothetical protein